MDIIKVRIQLAGATGKSPSPFTVAGEIMGEGGAAAFYRG